MKTKASLLVALTASLALSSAAFTSVHAQTLTIGVRGGPAVFEASALVDGDIDEHRPLLHLRDHLVGDEFGGACAGNEDGPDDKVSSEHLLTDGHRC